MASRGPPFGQGRPARDVLLLLRLAHRQWPGLIRICAYLPDLSGQGPGQRATSGPQRQAAAAGVNGLNKPPNCDRLRAATIDSFARRRPSRLPIVKRQLRV